MTPTDALRDRALLAQRAARRLGHRWIGAEHLLFAACVTDDTAGSVLRAAGFIPVMIWADIRTLAGTGPWAVDRDALAAIGIDLDDVLATVVGATADHHLAPPIRHRRVRNRRVRTGHIALNAVAQRCLMTATDDIRDRGSAVCDTALPLAVLTSDSQTVKRLVRLADVDGPALVAALTPA